MPRNLSHLTENPPFWLALGFGGILLVTLAVFYYAIQKAAPTKAGCVLSGLLGWLMLLGVLASNDFFLKTDAVPPRFLVAVLPPMATILTLFLTKKGRIFLDRLSLPTLTWLHSIRVPVELMLYGLFIHHQIPEVMTFEGRNFDILAGLTAPLAGYWAAQNRFSARRRLLIWNFFALFLVLNIVTHAVLSAPGPLQQLAFEQPNVGVLKFPFIGLPGFVVPVVLFGHFVSIRRLIWRSKFASQDL